MSGRAVEHETAAPKRHVHAKPVRERSAAECVLGLQGAVGNRVVAQLLDQQGAAGAMGIHAHGRPLSIARQQHELVADRPRMVSVRFRRDLARFRRRVARKIGRWLVYRSDRGTRAEALIREDVARMHEEIRASYGNDPRAERLNVNVRFTLWRDPRSRRVGRIDVAENIAPVEPAHLAPEVTPDERDEEHEELELDPRRAYRLFIRKVASYGLPVRFLRKVEREVAIMEVFAEGADDKYNYALNTLFLSGRNISDVTSFSPHRRGIGGEGTVEDFYHESTHAYLDVMEDDPRFERLIAAGKRHYRGAPLQGGGRASDEWRVCQEAAGEYVGHRAKVWWGTLDQLADRILRHRLTEQTLSGIRQSYDARMAQRVFGYDEQGGRKRHTTRPISATMKRFLDQELLEDKIPDRFDAVPAFRRMVTEATSGPSRAGARGR